MNRAILPVLLLFAAPPALGAPDRVAWTSSEGTDIPDMVLSRSGGRLAFVESSSNELRLLDTATWEVASLAVCSGATPATGVATWSSGTVESFLVGCHDGSIDRWDLEDGELTQAAERLSVSTGPVLGLVAVDDLLLVLEDPDGGANPTLHAVDLNDDSVDDGDGYPTTLGHSSFEDIGATSTYAVIAHGGDNVSKVQISTGGATTEEPGGASVKATDLDVYDGSTTSVLLAGGTLGVARFQLGTNEIQLVIEAGDGITDATALAILEEEDDAGSLVVGDSGAGTFLTFEFDTASGTPGDIFVESFDFPEASTGDVGEMVGSDGYVYAATDSGDLWVLTDRPWVELLDVTTSRASGSVTSGDQVTLTFVSDAAGDWDLRLGAETDGGGTSLDTGELAADEQVVATVTVDDGWAEGRNLLRVVVDAAGSLGHAAAWITVDNPPSRVTLDEADVGFGDRKVVLEFDGIDDADLARYDVYISLTEFDPDAWATGGPIFDGFDDIRNPIAVEAEPGVKVIAEISPLTNGQTYYVAVRAVDSGGLEGPMSNVVTARPRETAGAAGLAGEAGGFCGPAAPMTALGAFFGAAALLTRRRRGLAALLVTSALGVATAPTASAAEREKIKDPRTKANVELRYGPVWFTGSDGRYTDGNPLNEVYGQRGNGIFLLEGGPSWRGILEGRFGIGIYHRKGDAVAVDDYAASSDKVKMDALPLTADVLVRFDILNEQILVPFGGVGASYWLWREVTDLTADIGERDALGGGKPGWHYVLGGQILLDPIQRSRASTLETRFGIHDSYLTVEYRDQVVGEWTDGLEFSGTSVTVGVRLHY